MVEKPDFMKSKTKRFCQEDEEVKWKGDNSDPKDPEWTPSMDWVELPTRSRRGAQTSVIHIALYKKQSGKNLEFLVQC